MEEVFKKLHNIGTLASVQWVQMTYYSEKNGWDITICDKSLVNSLVKGEDPDFVTAGYKALYAHASAIKKESQ